MQIRNKLIVILIMLSIFAVVDTVAASSFIRPSANTTMVTFAVIIVAVAVIIGFLLFHGGVKYVTPENVLDTEIRKHLYDYIDGSPGSHLREIARELDLKPSNAAWHLRKLEQTNLVRSRFIGGKKVYYLVEGGMEIRKQAIGESILKNNNAREIMQYLQDHPGKHLLEIAHALKLNHHVVKWHIKKMYMAELVEGDTSNSAYPVYYPTEIGIEALENITNYVKKTAA
ncbi:MAG: winged helix-turn-helix transcriptional regulator [Candidatus Thermoplasmatota archaeon]|nr:winged helix-turn-helix transcriptional regulator [Candidatus Thermoplasmatota archaeon]